MNNNFVTLYLSNTKKIFNNLDINAIEEAIEQMLRAKQSSGRIFIVGLGGSSAHAIHFASDLRKLDNINAVSPLENIAEFSALINDEGPDFAFVKYLERNKMDSNDILFVISVGGGDNEKNVSTGFIRAIDYAKEKNCKSISLTGREDGYANKNCDISILINVPDGNYLTSHTEGVQSVILHLIAVHPKLIEVKPKWESLDE